MQPPIVVGVGISTYFEADDLDGAVVNTQALHDLLIEHHGFDSERSTVLGDLTRGALLDALDEALPAGQLDGRQLVVVWTGHGTLFADNSLVLRGRATSGDVDLMSASDLAKLAVATKAIQVLLVFDTCHAAAGVASAAGAAAAMTQSLKATGERWFGVLAACHPRQKSYEGVLSAPLRRLLTEGPKADHLRRSWLPLGRYIDPERVLLALLEEWNGPPDQIPDRSGQGSPAYFLTNPVFSDRPGMIDHLLQAARGTSTDANFFAGRRGPLREIVTWLRESAAGVLFISGPSGYGKSAVLGRVVGLSDPVERSRILATNQVDDTTDPGIDSIDATVRLRRLTVEQVVAELAVQLPGAGDGSVEEFVGYAVGASRRRGPLRLALDGLDEMLGVEATRLIERVLIPLSPYTQVLITTSSPPDMGGLASALGGVHPPQVTVDLGSVLDDTLDDVRTYVTKRLAGVSREMVATDVAEAIVAEARAFEKDGPFLFARIVTAQLREDPVDTSVAGWRTSLDTSVDRSLDRDLDQLRLRIAGVDHPTAGRELLQALAWAEGAGLAATDPLWAAMATALSRSGTTYTVADTLAAVDPLRRHVTASPLGDDTVFGIAHQRLVEHLRASDHPDDATRVGAVVAEQFREWLAPGREPEDHKYLWFYAWSHLAAAGDAGMDHLRGLAAEWPALRSDVVLALRRRAATDPTTPAQKVDWLREAAQIAEEIDPEGSPVVARALSELSMAEGAAGNLVEADEHSALALAMARQFATDDDGRRALSAALQVRMVSYFRAGDVARAIRSATDALSLLSDPAGADWAGATMLHATMGLLHLQLGELERATAAADALRVQLNTFPDTDVVPIQLRRMALLAGLSVRVKVATMHCLQGAEAGPDLAADVEELIGMSLGTAEDPTYEFRCAGVEGVRSAFGAVALGVVQLPATHRFANPRDLAAEGVQLAEAITPMTPDLASSVAAMLWLDLQIAGLESDDQVPVLDRVIELGRLALAVDPSTATLLADALQLCASRVDTERARTLLGESVEVLGRSAHPTALLRRIGACHQLATMNLRDGELVGGVMWARQGRRLLNEQPELKEPHRWGHIGLLIQSSYSITRGDFVEGVSAAELALELIAALGNPTELKPHRMTALSHLGTASLNLGDPSEAVDRFEQGLAILPDDPDEPGMAQLRLETAATLLRAYLAADDGSNGTVGADVDLVAMAEGLLDASTDVESHGQIEALALIGLVEARARANPAAIPQRWPGLDDAIARIVDMLLDGTATVDGVSRGINLSATPVWSQLLSHPRLPDDMREALRANRLFQSAEADEAVDYFRAALAATDDVLSRSLLRSAVRRQRRHIGEALNVAWIAATGALPDWMEVSADHESLVWAWVRTQTWRASEAFVHQNPGILDQATEAVVEEFFAPEEAEVLNQHLEVLRAARCDGIAEAFQPLIMREMIREWAGSVDPVAFITDRASEFDPQRLREELDRQGLGLLAAVHELVSRGESNLATDALDGKVDWETQITRAMTVDDPQRIRALAVLSLADTHSGADVLGLAAAGQILAIVLAGQRPDPVEHLTIPADQIGATRSALVDALSGHLAHAAELGVAIGQLTTAA